MARPTEAAVIDISVPIVEGMPIWPGSTGVRITRTMALERGDEATVSQLDTDVHVGTHLDAPGHFIPGGDPIDRVPLDVLVGQASVVHLPDCSAITPADLERAVPHGAARVLFRTRNSKRWREPRHMFTPDYVALTLEAARWVVDRGIRLIGVDYLSVQRFSDSAETHRVLLGAGVVLLEGLDLSAVLAGEYELFCLPLKLVGAEAAPARAVIRPLPLGSVPPAT